MVLRYLVNQAEDIKKYMLDDFTIEVVQLISKDFLVSNTLLLQLLHLAYRIYILFGISSLK